MSAAPVPTLPLPALHASHGGVWLRGADGTTRALGKGDAIMAAADTPLILLNAPLVASRLGYPDLSGLDLLELFAFIHPARFMVPTPKGLAHVLGLEEPKGDDAVPELLQRAAGILLERWLAMGAVILRIVSLHAGHELAETLRDYVPRVFSFDGHDDGEQMTLVYVAVRRRVAPRLIRLALEIDPHLFYAVDNLRESNMALSAPLPSLAGSRMVFKTK